MFRLSGDRKKKHFIQLSETTEWPKNNTITDEMLFWNTFDMNFITDIAFLLGCPVKQKKAYAVRSRELSDVLYMHCCLCYTKCYHMGMVKGI